MIEKLMKLVPYALVATVAVLAVNLTNDCDCGKNRGKGQQNSHQARGRGSAGDRGQGRWMREGLDQEAMEGLKKRMGRLKKAKAEDATNEEG